MANSAFIPKDPRCQVTETPDADGSSRTDEIVPLRSPPPSVPTGSVPEIVQCDLAFGSVLQETMAI